MHHSFLHCLVSQFVDVTENTLELGHTTALADKILSNDQFNDNYIVNHIKQGLFFPVTTILSMNLNLISELLVKLSEKKTNNLFIPVYDCVTTHKNVVSMYQS